MDCKLPGDFQERVGVTSEYFMHAVFTCILSTNKVGTRPNMKNRHARRACVYR